MTSGDTTLNIVSPSAFPTSGNFRILVDTELMLVTGVAGNVFTVTRAAESWNGSQVATAHASGSLVVCVHTATSASILNDTETNEINTDQSTSSASYADLATVGPSVTITSGITQNQLVVCSAYLYNTGVNETFYSISFSGNAAVDADRVIYDVTVGNQGSTVGRPKLLTGVTSGSTHVMKYKTAGGTGHYNDRRMTGASV